MADNVILVERGSDRGIWFETDATMKLFLAHPTVQQANVITGERSIGGFGAYVLRVADAEKWGELARNRREGRERSRANRP